jgi:hypothetical protein
MYQRPGITQLSTETLADLLGPVETQYDCQTCLINPQLTTVANGREVIAVVNTSGCTAFENCLISIVQQPLNRPGDECGTSETFAFSAAQGEQSGNQWLVSFTTQDFYCQDVQLQVTLTADGQQTETCTIIVPVVFTKE